MVFLIVVSQHRSRAKLKQPKIKSNFFTARDNDIFTKSEGCEEKRKEGGREARNETRKLSKFGK